MTNCSHPLGGTPRHEVELHTEKAKCNSRQKPYTHTSPFYWTQPAVSYGRFKAVFAPTSTRHRRLFFVSSWSCGSTIYIYQNLIWKHPVLALQLPCEVENGPLKVSERILVRCARAVDVVSLTKKDWYAPWLWLPRVEEDFANALIDEFKAGSLHGLPEGTSMRGFLAKMLRCVPKR